MQVFVKKRMVYVFAFLVLFLAALSYPVAVKAEAGNYYLSMGEYLSGGMRITSLNGKYFAMMQTDGNFVIYQSDTQKPLWHTNTYGGNYTSYRAMMQTDGNFVVYGIKNGAMTALWNAGTHVYGSGTYRLELGDDSVLRVKKNGNTVWNSPNAPINSIINDWHYFYEPTAGIGGRTQGYSSSHLGVDIGSGVSTSTNLYAIGEGIATFKYAYVKDSNDGIIKNSSWGNHIELQTPGTGMARYAHLSAFANGYAVSPYIQNIMTSSGSTYKITGTKAVSRGEYLGKIGNTGYSYGVHLHFEYLVNGIRVNPDEHVKLPGGTECNNNEVTYK